MLISSLGKKLVTLEHSQKISHCRAQAKRSHLTGTDGVEIE